VCCKWTRLSFVFSFQQSAEKRSEAKRMCKRHLRLTLTLRFVLMGYSYSPSKGQDQEITLCRWGHARNTKALQALLLSGSQNISGKYHIGAIQLLRHTPTGEGVGSSVTEGGVRLSVTPHSPNFTYLFTYSFLPCWIISLAVKILLLNTSAAMKATLVYLELGRKRSLCWL